MSVKPWDMLNPNEPKNADLGDKRMSICETCPELIELTKTCKKCGCFMIMKTKLENATCPLDKW